MQPKPVICYPQSEPAQEVDQEASNISNLVQQLVVFIDGAFRAYYHICSHAGKVPSTLPATTVAWGEPELHYLNHSSTDNFSLIEILECLACLLKFVFSRNSIREIEDTSFCQSHQLGEILPCPSSIGTNDLNLFYEIFGQMLEHTKIPNHAQHAKEMSITKAKNSQCIQCYS